jgi:uncharacterized membrane protein YgcG
MSASVFISYASQDQKVANTLCKALEGRGFSCWIASRNIAPGENFQIAIVRAIRGAKIMLLVFTGNSNNSDEMAKELALASQSKLIVVPLLIDDVRPNDAFSYEFATRQWIDFFSDWETAIEQLAHRIAAALATEAPAAQPAAVEAAPPMPAPTPDVIARAFADQPAAAAAPIGETLSGLAPAGPSPAAQTLAEPAGKTAVIPAAEVAAAIPVAAAVSAGPSSFQDAPAKRGAPVVLIVTLSLLVIVMIAGAAVILPSFLAKKPAPPTASAQTNTVTALTTTPAPPPTPPLVTQPGTATPGPAPMASETPTAPTAETPVQPTAAPEPAAAEDPDLDPETHRGGGRYGRHHGGGGGSSGGGGSADVPF